ncbi:MAG TPA: nuclear transport factor 2 family protein [Mucilaginibacter sp.]|jgi:hypothetical protein
MKKLSLIILICSNTAFAQNAMKKGITYKQHRYIEIIKQLAVLYEKGDVDAMAKVYADTARILGMTRYNPDTSRSGKSAQVNGKSVAQAKAGWKNIFENWEGIKMRLIEDPDGLDYAGAPFKVQSSWKLTLVNKRTKKAATTEIILFDWFNKDGKIACQTEYYDPASFIAAMQ